jgi:two-component system NtrC family sensor kinase
MPMPAHCPRCGKSLKAGHEMVGRRVRCSVCDHEFVLTEGPESPSLPQETPAATPTRSVPAKDLTFTSSMVGDALAKSAIPPSAIPPDEMLCRLEPRSLRWIFSSDALEKFLACPIEQLRQKTFLDFLHPDDRALAADEFRQTGEVGERHDFVLRVPNKSGLHYVRVYSQARYDLDGRINHIRCYLKDVTERIQAEQELRRRTEQLTAANERLRQANKRLEETQSHLVHSEKLASLGTLAAGMAHEINNPLAFAMNNVAVLEREIGHLLKIVSSYQEGWDELHRAEPELGARIKRLQEEADLPYLQENLLKMTRSTRHGLNRVAKIVENLRDFARLDRAEVGIIDLNQSIDQCLAMLTEAIADARITVHRRFEKLPALECAVASMNQVFLNLLLNAMQAIESAGRSSGEIEITSRVQEKDIVIGIADNGCGIPPIVQSKIFDPFFTTKAVGQGTGLGLSIAHRIISDHGGRIEVESTVGSGSRFRIILPPQRAERSPARRREEIEE